MDEATWKEIKTWKKNLAPGTLYHLAAYSSRTRESSRMNLHVP